MLARADAIVAIQEAEAGWARKALPGHEVILAPMAAAVKDRAAPGADDRILFVGSNTAPNVSGLAQFLADVWPAVRSARPGAQLDVAGSVARAFTAAPEGVRFLGVVDSLAPLYAEAGVVISPLNTGSGLKIKLIEAMAEGKAIVASPITLQGVEDIASDAVVVAEEPRAFAEALVRLLGSSAERETLAARALVVARNHFSPEGCYSALVNWVKAPPRG
jgi:succinoglycan biosynthesis protein ExoO